MNHGNPYDTRPSQNGFGASRNGGGGGGFGGRKQEPLTPEQLKRLRLPVTVVITGNDRIPDGDAMTVDRLAKLVEAKGVTIRGGTNSDTDQIVTRAVRYVEQHAPWANKGDDGKRFFENKNDGSRIEIRGNGSSFNTDECFEFAQRFFVGDFETVNKFQRANHGKTARLLFGKNLKNPTQLVLVWSEDGADTPNAVGTQTGWVGHVVRMAFASGITVINMKNPNAETRLNNFLENLNVQQQSQARAAGQEQYQQQRPTGGSSGFTPDFGEDCL